MKRSPAGQLYMVKFEHDIGLVSRRYQQGVEFVGAVYNPLVLWCLFVRLLEVTNPAQAFWQGKIFN